MFIVFPAEHLRGVALAAARRADAMRTVRVAARSLPNHAPVAATPSPNATTTHQRPRPWMRRFLLAGRTSGPALDATVTAAYGNPCRYGRVRIPRTPARNRAHR